MFILRSPALLGATLLAAGCATHPNATPAAVTRAPEASARVPEAPARAPLPPRPPAAPPPSVSPIAAAPFPAPEPGGSCDDLRARFFALLEAPAAKRCASAGECTCVSRIDVSGSAALLANTAAARDLRALGAAYVAKACSVSGRSGSLVRCEPRCVAGACVR